MLPPAHLRGRAEKGNTGQKSNNTETAERGEAEDPRLRLRQRTRVAEQHREVIDGGLV